MFLWVKYFSVIFCELIFLEIFCGIRVQTALNYLMFLHFKYFFVDTIMWIGNRKIWQTEKIIHNKQLRSK